MRSWGVGRRIFFGFGMVLALLAVLVGFSWWATGRIAAIFIEYRATARQTLLVNDFVEDLFEARMAAFLYRIGPADDVATEVTDNIGEIIAEKPQVEALFGGRPEIEDRFAQLAVQIDRYRDSFSQMTVLQARHDSAVAQLVMLGPKARKQLTSIMESAYRDGDTRAAFYAGIAQQELMLGRFYTERFLLTNDQAAFSAAARHMREAGKRLDTLLETLQNPDRRVNAEATIADLAQFQSVSNALWTIVSERNAIRDQELDTLGPSMQDAYEQIVETVVAQQRRLGPEGAAIADWTMWLVSALGVVALLGGAALALVIARSVTRSVTLMAKTMTALANDDLNIEVRGADQSHELGLMAKALTVFKQNAVRVRQMAGEKEEADRAASKARRRMMSELQTAFGMVVDRAVAGEFSSQVPTEFPDPEINELAGSVNRLLRTMQSGLDETGRVLAQVAQGDLRERMGGTFEGAFLDLQGNVNQTVDRLSELIQQITATVRGVRDGSEQITVGANDLAQRAEQQSSALEETAATMEEMSASIKSNADSSASASRLASEASERADTGGAIVRRAVVAMQEIEKSAGHISDIVNVIDSIAFQTNLLALNAAVEAARAGDAGKGFAVVASEVRALAQRTSESSRHIRALIETSATQVSEGVALVNETGASLEGIVASILQVEATIKRIAQVSVEQSTGAQEVSSAVAHMDEMTQQNATMAEQSASNARNLATGAQKLQTLVSFFRVQTAKHPGQEDAA